MQNRAVTGGAKDGQFDIHALPGHKVLEWDVSSKQQDEKGVILHLMAHHFRNLRIYQKVTKRIRIFGNSGCFIQISHSSECKSRVQFSFENLSKIENSYISQGEKKKKRKKIWPNM